MVLFSIFVGLLLAIIIILSLLISNVFQAYLPYQRNKFSSHRFISIQIEWQAKGSMLSRTIYGFSLMVILSTALFGLSLVTFVDWYQGIKSPQDTYIMSVNIFSLIASLLLALHLFKMVFGSMIDENTTIIPVFLRDYFTCKFHPKDFLVYSVLLMINISFVIFSLYSIQYI